MHYAAINEVSREIPPGIIQKYGDSALFTAYGCVLLECETGKGYTYRALNLKTGRSAVIHRRTNPLMISGVAAMTERIRLSPVAGKGKYEIDMPPGENLLRESLADIQNHIFEAILPEHGYGIREKQMELAAHILEAIGHRTVSLSEADVGTGKTHAYLIAAALAKRGRVNDFWLRGYYPDQSYAASAYMPVVVSTASIALQNAIVKDYIPEISRILMAHGIIKTPLSCVLRKGREHYVCEKNLCAYYRDADESTQGLLAPLFKRTASIDLADAEGLTPYIKRRIGVSGRCDENCPYYNDCRYLRHMRHVQSGEHDFQVCNHNYFLADVIRRSKGQSPLIPHYQAVIIDEAHKFLQAARQMYGVEFGSLAIPRVVEDIGCFTFQKGVSSAMVQELARKLMGQNRRLFQLLLDNIPPGSLEEETERYKTVMDKTAARHLRNIRNIGGELSELLSEQMLLLRYRGRCSQIRFELSLIREQAGVLEKYDELVYWLERPEERYPAQTDKELETLLCAIPKQLSDMLYADLWSSGIPVVLTSGTLSAAGSFEHIKRKTGLDRVNSLMETSKPSPFRHRENILLYISEIVPFPNNQDNEYITAVAEEAGRLIQASHGHAALLFTSYKAMDQVFALLERKGPCFPLFRLDRGGINAIDRFRKSGNGVLFASGALWEGIDLPGDVLSLLIIVKLPFAAPDPVSEYEQTLYPSMEQYKNSVLVPEMIIKLKQGFGRLIRRETDTGVVALLDYRVREGGPYRTRVLNALPNCRVTSNLEDVETFIQSKKGPDYFV
ncbi:MAG: ATP-dependent DNA helicase [Bacillota bacterium]